ncbi:TIR domain-containing protein [Mesorhizobium kowhaii]|uniref:TIR domain-containing protein n=1 Tax=Mesorhizobium kowhaii TaxID=1300272 RepID=UPI0035E493CD
MSGIFISHTHSDRALADAIRIATQALFGERITVHYSTNKELEGGIRPGEDWFRWIGDRVRESDVAFILLTPSSIQKPWLLWEAGAVAGVALAGETENQRKLRPITYKLKGSELPTVFGREQVSDGLNLADIKRLFEDLISNFSDGISTTAMIRVAQMVPQICADYLSKAEAALKMAPILVTEAAVQEWLERIERLERSSRFSEIEELHDWLNLAFGRDNSAGQRPLDLRIHRRLGELYARAGRAERAAMEFELARQMAPRDVYVLRRLGKAYLDQRRLDNAGELLDAISELDSRAFVRNAENAALKARWHTAQGGHAAAIDILKAAAENNPDSYYVFDLLGQAQLEDGRLDDAKLTYRSVLAFLSKLRDRNIWTAATGFNASLLLDDGERMREFVGELKDFGPTSEEVTSIIRGAEKIAEALGNADDALAMLKKALRS